MFETTVVAPEDAGIASISGIRSDLVAAIDKAGPGSSVVLDLGRIRKADSSLAQLIIAFRAEAAAKGLAASIRGGGDEDSIRSMLCCDYFEEAPDSRRRGPSRPSGGAS